MWKRKVNYFPGATSQQRANHDEWTRRDDAFLAQMCNSLEFWRICGRPVCRRRHACSHDPQACFDRIWPAVPEDFKMLFRATLKARHDGLPPDQARERAEAEAAAILAKEAALNAAADAARTPATIERTPPTAPRLRGL